MKWIKQNYIAENDGHCSLRTDVVIKRKEVYNWANKNWDYIKLRNKRDI
jgi:hypothetical protein